MCCYTMSVRLLAALAALFCGLIPGLPVSSEARTAPNIIFILVDDLSWSDVQTGAVGPNVLNGTNHGSDFYQTPNIARLAAEGLSFTHCYVQPNCAPSRAAILSGQYAPRSGNGVYIVHNLNRATPSLMPTRFTGPPQREDIPSGHIISAEALQAGGYVTAHFGKYHVGNHDEGTVTLPENQGYNYNFGGNHHGNPGAYHASGQTFSSKIGKGLDPFAQNYTPAYIANQLVPVANNNGPEILNNTDKHVEDAIGDAALHFMQTHRSSAHADRPFYLQLHPYAVHTPNKDKHARQDLLNKFKALPAGTKHDNASYAAILENMDQTIGRILNYLDDPNADGNPDDSIAANTLILFTSDNGGHVGSTDNSPLRHVKGSFYNGGIRVPLIVRQPGTIPPSTQTDTLVHAVDFYPTLIEHAGLTMPAGIQFDGESFAQHMRNPEQTRRNRGPLFYHFPGYLDSRARPCEVVIKTVNQKVYKLIYTYDLEYTGRSSSTVSTDALNPLPHPWELYCLTDDIAEQNNLLNHSYANWMLYGNLAHAMAEDLHQWLTQSSPDWNAAKIRDTTTGQEIDFPTPQQLPIVYPQPGQHFIITSFSAAPAASALTFNTEPGFNYQIETSRNLFDWSPITNLTATTTNTQLHLPEPATQTQRFYRCVLHPAPQP